jgi:Mg/Co/Ni transporter MgtE
MNVEKAVNKILDSVSEITNNMSKDDYESVLKDLREELYVLILASMETKDTE